MSEAPLNERFKPMAKCGYENKILADNILPLSFHNHNSTSVSKRNYGNSLYIFIHCQKFRKY